MNAKYRINRDIYQTLSLPTLRQFSVIEIRNIIQTNSDFYGNKNTARLFVVRQLQALEKAGLITSDGYGRNKVYSKSDLFHQADFELIDKRVSQKSSTSGKSIKRASISCELENEKSDIEAELTVALAEIEEYKLLMKRSDELNKLLHPSYSNATRKAASLMAKLNVWTGALELIKQNRSVTC